MELPDQRKHPLAPLIEAWQEHAPVQVTPETRKDKRLLAVQVLPPTPERKRGMLFGGLVNELRDAQLPLFQDLAPPVRKSVAILDLADASGVPVMSKGRGAPLSLRLFIRAGLSVKPQDRRHSSSRFPVTVEELRGGLFPNGWQAGRDWPRIKQALIEARDYTITDAGGGRWFMLALRRLPPENAHGLPDLKDQVVLDIAFPEGMTTGPEVDLPAMGELSVESGARFRAYIAAKSLAWKPGLTRRPVPGSSGRFGWSRNPADYPVLTRADRRRLAFGEKDQKNRTRTQVDAAWRDLPGLVVIAEDAIDPKIGERGWRIVPPEAVDYLTGEFDLPNRGILSLATPLNTTNGLRPKTKTNKSVRAEEGGARFQAPPLLCPSEARKERRLPPVSFQEHLPPQKKCTCSCLLNVLAPVRIACLGPCFEIWFVSDRKVRAKASAISTVGRQIHKITMPGLTARWYSPPERIIPLLHRGNQILCGLKCRNKF